MLVAPAAAAAAVALEKPTAAPVNAAQPMDVVSAAASAPSPPTAVASSATPAVAADGAAASQSEVEPDTESEILIVVRLDLPGPHGQRIQEAIFWNLNGTCLSSFVFFFF